MIEEATVYGIKAIKDGQYAYTFTDLFWLIKDAHKQIEDLKKNPLWDNYEYEIAYFHIPMKDD